VRCVLCVAEFEQTRTNQRRYFNFSNSKYLTSIFAVKISKLNNTNIALDIDGMSTNTQTLV